jgi:hypothetical protein
LAHAPSDRNPGASTAIVVAVLKVVAMLLQRSRIVTGANHKEGGFLNVIESENSRRSGGAVSVVAGIIGAGTARQ